MTRHPSKEVGITLIELLATIVILSIVIVLTYSIFFNGLTSSEKANEQVNLQQEMNLLLTSITKLHENESSYAIIADKTPNASTVSLQGTNNTFKFSNSDFDYTLYYYQVIGNIEKHLDKTIHSAHALHITIIISNKNQPNQKYEIKTIISRL